jgi:hypothetical protein
MQAVKEGGYYEEKAQAFEQYCRRRGWDSSKGTGDGKVS